MPVPPVIATFELTKHFPHVNALTDFSVQIEPGEVVGLLGPNGSGKSTLVRLLLGFLRPTSGRASVLGCDCATQSVEVHRKVGYLPGDARLFRTMRGRDALAFFADLRPAGYLKRAITIADRLQLDLSRWIAFMSTGMRQKLALSVVMALDVPVIILDEPTANLDPSVRSEVLRLVCEAHADGRTIIFSSHVLSEIEEICNRVLILRGGRLVHTQDLRSATPQHQFCIDVGQTNFELPPKFSDRVTNWRFDKQAKRLRFCVAGDTADILRWLADHPLKSLNIQPVDLRTIYDRFHHEEPA